MKFQEKYMFHNAVIFHAMRLAAEFVYLQYMRIENNIFCIKKIVFRRAPHLSLNDTLTYVFKLREACKVSLIHLRALITLFHISNQLMHTYEYTRIIHKTLLALCCSSMYLPHHIIQAAQ